MPNWKTTESNERLLAAMVASQDSKVCGSTRDLGLDLLVRNEVLPVFM